MILGYKFLAKLTPSQEELIYSHFFAGNQIFNYLVFKEKEFIKEREIAKEKGIKLKRPKAKEQYHDIKAMLIERKIPYNSKLMQQMQRNFRSQGIQNAEKRTKGVRVGDWKYRNSRNYNGITISTTKEQYTLFEVDNDKHGIIKLFGEYMSFVKHRNFPNICDIKSLDIKFENGQFFFIFSVHEGLDNNEHIYEDKDIKELENLKSIGLDTNINAIVLSDGTNHRTFNTALLKDLLAQESKKVERMEKKKYQQSKRRERAKKTKSKLGKNYFKTEKEIQKIQTRLNNIRKDFRHKLTLDIVKFLRDNLYNHLIMEDLNVQDMVSKDNKPKNMKKPAAKSMKKNVLNLAFAEVQRLLTYKCLKGLANEKIYVSKVNPAYTSKRCSCCGSVFYAQTLADRRFVCECGLDIDRDVNAAINIKWVWNEPKEAEKLRNALASIDE